MAVMIVMSLMIVRTVMTVKTFMTVMTVLTVRTVKTHRFDFGDFMIFITIAMVVIWPSLVLYVYVKKGQDRSYVDDVFVIYIFMFLMIYEVVCISLGVRV